MQTESIKIVKFLLCRTSPEGWGRSRREFHLLQHCSTHFPGLAMVQSELTRCGFPRQRRETDRVGLSTWSICAAFFVTLLADISAARDVSRVENFFRAHQQNLGPTYSSVTLPNFFRYVTPSNVQQRREAYGSSNLVFVHQNKAAGSTVKAMLEARCTAHAAEMTFVTGALLQKRVGEVKYCLVVLSLGLLVGWCTESVTTDCIRWH